VASARVTRSNVHDGTQLPHLIRGMRGGGRPLLADSAYGSEANAELLRRRGFLPVLRPHGQARRGIGTRMRMKEFWRNRRLYRRRGTAEALFGGLANRYGSRTGSKRVRTKVVSLMLMLVAHNLRTLLRLQAWEGGEVLILWNYSTNPPGSTREVRICDPRGLFPGLFLSFFRISELDLLGEVGTCPQKCRSRKGK